MGNGSVLCLNAKHSFDLGFRTTLLKKLHCTTSLDFFIFSFLKTEVFKESINNLQELIARITLIEMQRDNTGYIAAHF
jgi:hypothetical protein